MAILFIIAIALFFGWWLSISDLSYSISSIVATRSLNGYVLMGILIGFIIIGGILFAEPFSIGIEDRILLTTPASALIISISAFLTVLITSKISSLSSAIYAVMASFIAWKFLMYREFDINYLIRNFLGWVTAPLFAGVLSYFLTLFYKKLMRKSDLHFFRLSYYLRFGIILNTIIFSILVGANNGAVLMTLNNTVKTNFSVFFDQFSVNKDHLIYVISVIIIAAVTFYVTNRKTVRLSQTTINSGSESVLLVLSAANIILFLYTLPAIEIPLASFQIIFAATVGNILTRENIQIENKRITKWLLSLIINPLAAFFFVYISMSIISHKYLILENGTKSGIKNHNIINVTNPVIMLLIIIVLAILLIHFIRENKLKIKAQKEALKHQETLYENEKSLSEMEVKTILIENNSLNTKLELKRQELTNIALNISEQKTFLEHLCNELREIQTSANLYEKNKKAEKLEREIIQKMNFSMEIESFYTEIETLHKDFNLRLYEQHPNLTENDKRLVTLLRLGFSTKHISSLTNISPKSVEISRYRLRNKLGLSHDQKLILYLKSL